MFTYTMTLGGNHVPNRLYSSRRLKRSSAQPESKYYPHAHFSNIILLSEMFFPCEAKRITHTSQIPPVEIGWTLNEDMKALCLRGELTESDSLGFGSWLYHNHWLSFAKFLSILEAEFPRV